MTRIRLTFGAIAGLSIVMSGVCAANAATTSPVTKAFLTNNQSQRRSGIFAAGEPHLEGGGDCVLPCLL